MLGLEDFKGIRGKEAGNSGGGNGSNRGSQEMGKCRQCQTKEVDTDLKGQPHLPPTSHSLVGEQAPHMPSLSLLLPAIHSSLATDLQSSPRGD